MISPDGRYVAFRSEATNLVRDENGSADAFVRDVVAGTTLRVSVGPQGVAADGEMPMDTPGVGFGAGVVTFCNAATNLVAGDTNDAIDIFAHFRAVEVAFEPFGVGLAGSGDLVPHLFGTDGDGVSYALDVWGGLGGAHGMLMVGLGQTELPAMGGTLYVDPAAPWLPLMFVLSGSVAFDGPGAPAGATVAPMLATQQASFGSAPVDTGGLVVIDPPQGLPGEGAVTLWFSLTGAEGMTLHLQAVIHDPGAPEGVALTNALHMSVNDSVND
jgi:hypothetical protein